MGEVILREQVVESIILGKQTITFTLKRYRLDDKDNADYWSFYNETVSIERIKLIKTTSKKDSRHWLRIGSTDYVITETLYNDTLRKL